MHKHGKIQEAIKHLEKVIGTDPADTDTLKWLQNYYAQNAKKKDIAILERKLLEIDPLTSFNEYSLQIPVVHREENESGLLPVTTADKIGLLQRAHLS